MPRAGAVVNTEPRTRRSHATYPPRPHSPASVQPGAFSQVALPRCDLHHTFHFCRSGLCPKPTYRNTLARCLVARSASPFGGRRRGLLSCPSPVRFARLHGHLAAGVSDPHGSAAMPVPPHPPRGHVSWRVDIHQRGYHRDPALRRLCRAETKRDGALAMRPAFSLSLQRVSGCAFGRGRVPYQ